MTTPHFNERHGHAKRGSVSRTFKTWVRMRERCENPKAVNYDRYGGKGIKVCNRWSEFKFFLEDMGEKPLDMTIDRIDNSKGYSKKNCRWVSKEAQARNKSSNLFYEIEGRRQCLAEWAREYGLDYHFVRARIRRDWPILEALTKPKREKK